jgi:hypothetical protein
MMLARRFVWLLGLVIIFLAGVVVGSAGTVRFIQKQYEQRMNPDSWEPRTMTWLTKELELTPSQEEQVRPAVREAVADLSQLRERADRERRAILGRMLVQIAEPLSPSQQEKLQKLIRESRAKEAARTTKGAAAAELP